MADNDSLATVAKLLDAEYNAAERKSWEESKLREALNIVIEVLAVRRAK